MKKKPISVTYGLKYKDKDIDDEGRVITVELNKYYLIRNVSRNCVLLQVDHSYLL
jgi:hypothetical protein